MTPAEAAWVRAHAWTPFMRRQLWSVPGGWSYCACDTDICEPCVRGEHRFCDRRRFRPWPEWWIQNRPVVYVKPTAVWLADRACRSLCPCCPAGLPASVPRFELVPLFDLAATPRAPLSASRDVQTPGHHDSPHNPAATATAPPGPHPAPATRHRNEEMP